ncbi:MAG: Ig-like domain-containing protein [Geminicoccaceae bacterium]
MVELGAGSAGVGGTGYEYSGGGGGGGGVIEKLSRSIATGSHNVVVGAGGVSQLLTGIEPMGTRGGNSSFNGDTAFGGGAQRDSSPGEANGGSGAGGMIRDLGTSFVTYPPGTGVAGQGFAGGLHGGGQFATLAGGGGGGAGAAGGNASGSASGNGGAGVRSDITSLYYGGGGGGYASGGTPGAGGIGGGGSGTTATNSADDGTDGRGGGGGAALAHEYAGDGGDGTVVVAYYLPPPEAVLSSTAISPVNKVQVTAVFSLAPGSSFTTGDIAVTNGTASNIQLFSTGSGSDASATYTFDVTPAADGPFDIRIKNASFTDTVGVANTAASNQLAFIADLTAPAPPVGPVIADADDSAAKGDFITSVTEPDISGTAEANSTVEIYVGGIKVGETTASATGTWTYNFGAGQLSEGDNAVTMTAKDAAKNVSAPSVAQNITIDTIRPQLQAISIDPASVKFGETADISFLFNEEVVNFTGDDVVLDTGSMGAVTVDPGDPRIYHATFTPDVDFEGTVNVSVAANLFTDRAGNDNNAGNASSAPVDTLVPETAITGPTEPVTERFSVTITFSQDVTGFAVSDIVIGAGTATLVPGSFTALSASEYSIELDPVLGQLVTVDVPANVAFDLSGNANRAAATYSIQAGSPASEFERHRHEIRDALQAQAQRSLENTMAAQRRLVRHARDRFILEDKQEKERQAEIEPAAGSTPEPARAALARKLEDRRKPYSLESFFEYADGTLSGDAKFHFENGDLRVGARQLVFGDFDIVRSDDGSTTMHSGIRYVLERAHGKDLLAGYFIGAEAGRSTIEGPFEGRQNSIGATAGGYVIGRIVDNLYFDALVGATAHRNNVELANDVLALDSIYNSFSSVATAALTGTVGLGRVELWPELALIYGRNDVGRIEMTGRAYGQIDDELDLDVGAVSIGRAVFTPELRIALDEEPVATSRNVLELSPSLLCQQTEIRSGERDCGYGAGITLASGSADKSTRVKLRAEYERIGETSRAGAMLTYEILF